MWNARSIIIIVVVHSSEYKREINIIPNENYLTSNKPTYNEQKNDETTHALFLIKNRYSLEIWNGFTITGSVFSTLLEIKYTPDDKEFSHICIIARMNVVALKTDTFTSPGLTGTIVSQTDRRTHCLWLTACNVTLKWTFYREFNRIHQCIRHGKCEWSRATFNIDNM